MLLESWWPQLPASSTELLLLIVAALGAALVIYSQFVEAEHRRDLIRMLGAAALFVYALSIWNWIFIIVTAGIFIAALIEFVEIYMGIHKHTREDIKEYFNKKTPK